MDRTDGMGYACHLASRSADQRQEGQISRLNSLGKGTLRVDFAIAFMELAERGPDDLAGVVVAPSGDELLDEAFKVVGKRDVHAANY